MGQHRSATKKTTKTSRFPVAGQDGLKSGLIIVALTLLLSLFYFYQQSQQISHNRFNLHHQQQRALTLAVQQSTRQLGLIEAAFSRDQGLRAAIDSSRHGQLSTDFYHRWNRLIQNFQPASIALFNPDRTLLSLWPQAGIDREFQKFSQIWLTTLTQTGRPQHALYCQQQACNYYQFSQLRDHEQTIAFLVSGISLQPVLALFDSAKTRAQLLTRAPEPEASTDVLVYRWGYQLHHQASDLSIQNALATLSQTQSKPPHQMVSYEINNDRHDAELTVFSLPGNDASLLVTLQDLSPAYAALYRKTGLFAALVFLALSTLAWLMRRRIQTMNQPENDAIDASVAESSYLEPTLIDIDDYDTTQPLADLNADMETSLHQQLSTLKQYNEDINLALAEHMLLLAQAQQRSDQILDNAQAIVILQQADGVIVSINPFGEKLTGYSNRELSGKNFIDLYPDSNSVALHDLQTIANVAQGLTPQFQHDANLLAKNGEKFIIHWSHCCIHQSDDSAPLLLSSGIDVTQLRTLKKNLSWLANHDVLTSLYNRRRFEKALDSALAWAEKYRADGILITIDLDNFKDINDACGHKVGDIILRKVASTLQALTRSIDASAQKLTARLGGDEFAIILRNIDKEGGCRLSRRIIKALNGISHFQRHISFQLAASIGIATFSDAAYNATEVLSNANYARNQAKIDGRNLHQVFNPKDSHIEQTHHRIIWRDRIENALRNNRFVLHFQPILDIRKNEISHYETLIRMLGDDGELIAPGLFIHIAEQYGLIQQIDNYIIANAIAKQGALVAQGQDLTLTINLSAKAFDDPELFQKIEQAIQQHHANPQRLIFEITETRAVSNIVKARQMMTRIQALGCQFALDDFGTGFSSFHYLRKLPVDVVKIDGSFINELDKNSDNEVLVKALGEVASGFNKLTVAEFVDSMQTLDILRNAHIDYAQGYFIGKPNAQIPAALPGALVQGATAMIH